MPPGALEKPSQKSLLQKDSTWPFCARSKKDVEELYDELHQKFPDAEIIAQPCDVSDKKQLRQFADQIKLQWKSVNVLVNNAGIFLPGQVHKEKAGTLEKLLKTNLYSAYYLTSTS